MGFLGGASGKASACNTGDARDSGSIPGSGISPGEGNGNPPVFLPGESHGQLRLGGKMGCYLILPQIYCLWYGSHISTFTIHLFSPFKIVGSVELKVDSKIFF